MAACWKSCLVALSSTARSAEKWYVCMIRQRTSFVARPRIDGIGKCRVRQVVTNRLATRSCKTCCRSCARQRGGRALNGPDAPSKHTRCKTIKRDKFIQTHQTASPDDSFYASNERTRILQRPPSQAKVNKSLVLINTHSSQASGLFKKVSRDVRIQLRAIKTR